MRKIYLAGAAALLASVAACGQQPTATSEQSGATQAPSDAIYSAAGSVTAVSGEGVTISHGPVPDLQWPAMTMEFRAPSPDMSSEEHTSELQSLMRISYAVFCLK